jgi:hypothetical protein
MFCSTRFERWIPVCNDRERRRRIDLAAVQGVENPSRRATIEPTRFHLGWVIIEIFVQISGEYLQTPPGVCHKKAVGWRWR